MGVTPLERGGTPTQLFFGGVFSGARFHGADDGFETMRPSHARRGFE
jgi:hypothetical protein